MGQYLDFYLKNEMAELKKVVNKKLKLYGINQKDYDDFYSIAADVVWKCEESYSDTVGVAFKNYIASCIDNKIKQQLTKMHRQKRGGKDIVVVSLDDPATDDGETFIKDIIPDKKTVETEIFQENENCYSEKIRVYLEKLTILQRKVLKLIVDGFEPKEIRNKLHINQEQYNDSIKGIHTYENISVLF